MLNITTMTEATTVLAAINAKIAVVAARVRGVARPLGKRLDFWLFSKHPHGYDHPEPAYCGDMPQYACCSKQAELPSGRSCWQARSQTPWGQELGNEPVRERNGALCRS